MTRNQIEYWNLKEQQRSNQAREMWQMQTLDETKRSNLAREVETARSNLANESETHRANLEREKETRRSNRANESINRERNTINREHYERMDTETERANRARESLEGESNKIKSKDSSRNFTYNIGRLTEERRANMARESYNLDYLAETWRHNTQQEGIGYANAQAAQTSAGAAYQSALANALNAQTRAGELDLARQKYTEVEWAQGLANTRKTQSEADKNAAYTNRLNNQSQIDTFNANVNAESRRTQNEINWYDAETRRMAEERQQVTDPARAMTGVADTFTDLLRGLRGGSR